jgi:hypothetical chaperone protein
MLPVAGARDGRRHFCGIDFGTSNSAVCVAQRARHELVPLDGDHQTIPSAVFFNFASGRPMFGRAAIAEYKSGESGRLLRGLKRLLGHALFHEKTRIKGEYVALSDVLTHFLRHLKSTTEAYIGEELTDVVLGRPVQFVDDDEEANRAAQADLEAAARRIGFERIELQLEPIAAALEYETGVNREEIVLIVDIGGGTSDFSVVRVSPERAQAADRTSDILGNLGIRVGGADFDRVLSMAYVMPLLGLGSTYGAKRLQMPRAPYVDLSTWARVNFLYEPKVVSELRRLRREASRPELLERFMRLVEARNCHRLLGQVEDSKIDLTGQEQACVALGYLDDGLAATITRPQFADAIAEHLERIAQCVDAVLREARTAPGRIDTVFLTGGSSIAFPVQARIRSMLPDARIATGDMLGSVGKGLGLDARRKFG